MTALRPEELDIATGRVTHGFRVLADTPLVPDNEPLLYDLTLVSQRTRHLVL